MTDIKTRKTSDRLVRLARSFLDPRLAIHAFRMLHYYGYSHVTQRAKLTTGCNVSLAPNVSFRNAERIVLEDGVQLGEYCGLWASPKSGRIAVGTRTTFGPCSYVTAANYGLAGDVPLLDLDMMERDVIIGADCWIGAKAVVLAGVTIGNGTVIGAGAVVTGDIPAGAVAAGVPARVIRHRSGKSVD